VPVGRIAIRSSQSILVEQGARSRSIALGKLCDAAPANASPRARIGAEVAVAGRSGQEAFGACYGEETKTRKPRSPQAEKSEIRGRLGAHSTDQERCGFARSAEEESIVWPSTNRRFSKFLLSLLARDEDAAYPRPRECERASPSLLRQRRRARGGSHKPTRTTERLLQRLPSLRGVSVNFIAPVSSGFCD
jgi:hypothetical protein